MMTDWRAGGYCNIITDQKQNFGLGQGSTDDSDIWCIINSILMHMVVTYFIGIILVSVSGSVIHKRVGGGMLDDTGLVISAQSSIKITTSRNKSLTPDEAALFSEILKSFNSFSNYKESLVVI
jgi:hypothetical protein